MNTNQNLYQLAAQSIIRERDNLAKSAVDRQYAASPDDWKPYKEAGYIKSLRDADFNFTYLSEALAATNLPLFLDYVTWLKVLFTSLKFPSNALTETLKHMKISLEEILAPELASVAISYIDSALEHFPQLPGTIPSFLSPTAPLHSLANKYLEALLNGDRHSASRLILDAVENGVAIKDIYLQVFQETQREVGRLWQTNKITVAKEHFCTATTQMVISQLYPHIFSSKRNGYRLVATTVGEELHEMGMRMVADFFEMDGWDTYFIGANTPSRSIISAIEERQAHLVAISTTIPTHVSKVTELVGTIRENAGTSDCKVLVGGYPFNLSADLWKTVGADGYAPNALEAVQIADKLIGK